MFCEITKNKSTTTSGSNQTSVRKLRYETKTARQMETLNLIKSKDIKQEPCYEALVKVEANIPFLQEYLKQELHDEDHTVKKEVKVEEENDCETSQVKSEDSWTKHEPAIYIDDAEVGQGEGCPQDSSPQVQKAGNKERQLAQREDLKQSGFSDAHSDDVTTNIDSSTESDQMFSVCEGNTELCVTGASSGGQSDSKIETQKIGQAGKPYRCDVCGKEFVYRSKLKEHNRTHEGEKCDVCGAQFTAIRCLIRHMRTHTGEKPYKCEFCGQGFNKSGNLKSHKRTHTEEKPFKCDVCGTGFTENGNLKRHKRTHTGEKPYKCDVCGEEFARCNQLKIHKKSHTGEKPFKCDVCGAGYTFCRQLKIHKRSHKGEKPYKCDVCGVGYTFYCHLKRHKRSHTGERPYKCYVCGVSFFEIGALTKHRRTHTGEKPFSCEVCGAGFTESGSLNRHKKKHKDEKPFPSSLQHKIDPVL